MSKLIHARQDKEKLIDMLFTVVQELTYHGLSHRDKIAVAEHFNAIRNRTVALDVSCKLKADISGTKIRIKILGQQ